MENNFDFVIFDFDGTLVDTGEGVLKSVQYALDFYGVPDSDNMEKLRTFIGPPLYVSFRKQYHADDDLAKKLIAKFRERYSTKGITEYSVYDGIEESLKVLSEKGVKLGIASSKPTHFIESILKTSDLYKYFDAVIGVDMNDHESNKTRLINRCIEELGATDISKAIMVGDRHFDINGAKGAGIKSIGVLYGYGNREEFENAGADFIVGSAKDIIDIII